MERFTLAERSDRPYDTITADYGRGLAHEALAVYTNFEARPLLGAARGMLARLLAASGRKAEARDDLVQAIALDRSKMTVHLERAKATHRSRHIPAPLLEF